MRSVLLMVVFAVSLATWVKADPIFPDSVVSNDLEFIRTSDQTVFSCVVYNGIRRAEMPDTRRGKLFDARTFIFNANYKDGTSVELWAHSDFVSRTVALNSVEPVAQAIGKLPSAMRSKLDHVVIHKGDEPPFFEHLGHFFVLYSDNIQTRIRNHDLEETVARESVHATMDAEYLGSRVWRDAQQADGAFVTDYAASNPDTEDMAESALFAWAILMHLGRLPENVEMQVREIMPNRLAFFEDLLLEQLPFHRVGPEKSC